MDTIIKNAKIYVESGRFESAMLIRDGYIIAVGDIGEIEALAGQHKVIDAEGRTIVEYRVTSTTVDQNLFNIPADYQILTQAEFEAAQAGH